jgi:heme-degrading monooxygenase HmoA
MLARVTRVKIHNEMTDNAIEKTDSSVIPDIRDDSGFAGIYVLGDRQTGDTIVITLWESSEAVEASSAKVSQRFGMLGEYMASPPEPSQTYEVMTSYVPSKAPSV